MPTLRPSRYAAVIFAVALAIVGVAPGQAQSQQPPPRFEPSECPFEGGEWLESARIECGYLDVPERRDVPGSRRLRIAVAVVRSTSESPRPDPVVYLTGGPGYSTLRSTRAMVSSSFWRSLSAERDLVFFDQRGTGYSDPTFCPELNDALRAALFQVSEAVERHRRVRTAMTECRDRMQAAGVDLGAYHSGSIARDLADLRVALGYDEWNLYGVSYGTRLALVTMRDAPQGIRSAVLSATIPPNAAEQPLTNYQEALQRVFAGCAADPNCTREYPELESRFYETLDHFGEQPWTITMDDTVAVPSGALVVGGDLAAAAVFEALYSGTTIPFIPLLTRVFAERRSDLLKALATRIGDPQASSRGLFLSVECYERAPSMTPDARSADAERAPRLAPHGDLIRPYLDDCDAWHRLRASPAELEAVRSTIPTLIFTGFFDPITPPSWGTLTAETLARSVYVEVPNAGHGIPKDACTRGIMLAFLDDPLVPPDTGCNEARAPITFVTDVHLNSGIYRAATALQRGPEPATVTWLSVTVLTLLSGLLLWPLRWLMRRRHPPPPNATGWGLAARWVAALAALLAISFLVLLAWTVLRTARTAPLILAFGVPGSAGLLFLIPWLVLVLGGLTLALAVAAWRQRWWSTPWRVHYLLVGMACLSYVGFLSHWRLF
jgi:pimeloyl-ACP methyl ester carboxylesterase